jgi:putative phosphoesterase
LSFSPLLVYFQLQKQQADTEGVEIMVMRVGVLSDTHLSRVSRALRDIVELKLAGVKMILHAGDYVSPDLVGFFREMNFHGVHGNMDPLEVRLSLPEKEVVQIGSWRVGLIHGRGSPAGLEDRIRLQFQDVDVIVYGHSHRSANHTSNGVLWFNPGTASGHAPFGSHSVGVLEFGDEVHGEIIEVPG